LETVAVYCEPKLKTYGFKKATDLSLLSWVADAKWTAACGQIFRKLGASGLKFRLVTARGSENGRITIHLLIDSGMETAVRSQFEHMSEPILENDEGIHWVSPVEMLFFHGPHYGDRYGIVDLVFGVLERESIPVILWACSASSIYLVLPHKTAQHAVAVLSEAIEIPTDVRTHCKDPREKAIHDST